MELAAAADYPQLLTWCYPVAVDAYGLTAARVWLRAVHSARVQRWAKLSSLFVLMVSMAAGGLHAFARGGQLPTWATFVVSMLPALMLGLAVHLLVLVRADHAPAGGAVSVAAPVTGFAPPAVNTATPGVMPTHELATTEELPPAAAVSMPAVAAVPAATAEPALRQRPTKRAAARAFYDAEIGPGDRRGSSELGELFAERFAVHEATGRQWVVAFRREDEAAGLEAAS